MEAAFLLNDLGRAALTKGVGYSYASFLAKYPAARYWSPRQLVQADGSPISQINDLSANANHLVQATGSAQPTFGINGSGVGRAIFDASDFMQLAGAAALNIGSVTKLTLVAAIRQTTTATAIICDGGIPFSGSGGFRFLLNNPGGGAGSFGGGVGTGSANYNLRDSNGAGAVPRSYVPVLGLDTTLAAATEVALSSDGVDLPTVSAAAVGSVTGNIPSPSAFTVGRNTGASNTFLNSELFDLAAIPGVVDPADLLQFVQYLFSACRF